jgi:uridine kinase
MITQSHPKFSIGICGEWGTGKTTLMKVIEKKLDSIGKEHVLVWDDLVNNKKHKHITTSIVYRI